MGTLHVSNGRDLRIVNKITKDDNGQLKVVDFSIDQGWQGMAATSASFQDGAFKTCDRVHQWSRRMPIRSLTW
jgi:hypothetical protein